MILTTLLENALKAITNRINLSTGLSHPSDMNAAKEMFVKLHKAGESLVAKDIRVWAIQNGWQGNDAKELGDLAESIGNGKNVRIKDGPYWKDEILSILEEI